MQQPQYDLARIVGPFWRPKPTSSTTTTTFGLCYLWLDDAGTVIALEWVS